MAMRCFLCALLCGMLLLGSLPVAAELPAGLVYDDGFAWFEATTVRDTKDGKPFAKGWTLRCQLRVCGEVPDHSAFKVLVKKGGATVATLRADGSIYHFKLPAFNDMPSQMWAPALQDRQQVISGTGQFQAEVYFIRGDDLSEHLARTHVLDVHAVTKVRGTGEADAPDYCISRHGEAAASFIYQRPGTQDPYLNLDRSTHYQKNVVEVYFGTSADKDNYNLPRGMLRSTVDGQPLDLSGVQQYNDKDAISALMSPLRMYQVVHTAAGNVREVVDFRQFMVVLPLTWGKGDDKARDPRKASISDHPGKWEIQYVANGATIRTWRFTVGDDGSIAAHPEETQGLSFGPGAHFVEMAVPPGGASIDARLVPEQAKAGGFYGHAWQSAEALAAAAAVPAKGTAWP